MAFLRKKARSKGVPQSAVETAKPHPSPRRKISPPEVKILAAKAHQAGLTPKEVSEIVGCPPTTVSTWSRTFRLGGVEALVGKPTNAHTRRICSKLEKMIEQERRDNPDAGVRRIRDELKRHQGVQVSAETVRRVVNEAGLGNPPQQPKREPPGVRRFERELPNALWQIDIFTFQLKRMFPVYLVGIIDDHSRYIIAHGLFRQQTAEAVLEVVKGAIGQWGAPREILSDNGRQFAAWRGETKFQKVLKRQGIQHVRSAPHHPMTLGKIERFWKTIWTEFLEDALFASFADASQRVAHWVAYYNHQRPHQGIGGGCPADRFYGLADDIEEATKQGCRDNALRLALGQDTKSPLYLLGRLGETDVRVTRKGNDIEVKLGDTIHEIIRTGAPYGVDDNGCLRREEAADELERVGRSGEIPAVGDGTQGGDLYQTDMRDLRGVPAGIESIDGEDGSGGGRSLGAEEARQEAEDGSGVGERGAGSRQDLPGKGTGSLEAEVRGGQDVSGFPEEAGARRDASWRERTGEKKTEKSIQEEEEEEMIGYGVSFWPQGSGGDGPLR